MNNLPRLSIGLPVFNGEDYLAESLEALLGQSYENFELIISDNASTDGTAGICRRYGKQDSRIRYMRHPDNIGQIPNHNYVVEQATGDLFKWAASGDLYARDLVERCVDALDEYPHVVLAHSWEALIDSAGTVIKLAEYHVAADSPRAPERFRSMLFDGWDDYSYGVMRVSAQRRKPLHGSHHLADRTISTDIALHGPFYQVPDWLYFRRDHPERPGYTVRSRCAGMDPDRSSALRHPAARLYAEYLWEYIAAIKRAPLSPADRRECYRYLAQWLGGRALPVASRAFRGNALPVIQPASGDLPAISIDAVVAGRERRLS